jgi:hypothetical protein
LRPVGGDYSLHLLRRAERLRVEGDCGIHVLDREKGVDLGRQSDLTRDGVKGPAHWFRQRSRARRSPHPVLNVQAIESFIRTLEQEKLNNVRNA